MEGVINQNGEGALVNNAGLDDSAGTDCCCNGDLYYRLTLCYNQSHAGNPPEMIAVKLPFACGGCPLNTGRIVIYRGLCYSADGPESGCEPLACAMGKCEATKWPIELLTGVLIVSAGDLTCKGLGVTCATSPCVPVVPGCCTEDSYGPCIDYNDPTVCKYPKRFRITRQANYHTKNSFYNNIGNPCSDYQTCADLRITISLSAEYQCVEGGANTAPTLRTFGGSVTASGFSVAGYPGIDGTYNYDISSPGAGGTLCNVGSFIMVGNTSLVGALDILKRNNCSGNHDWAANDPNCRPSESFTCTAGRYIYSLSATCTAGFIQETDYRDCNLCIYNHRAAGYFVPPCGSLPNFEEDWQDSRILSSVVGCGNDTGTDYQNPGDPLTGFLLRNTNLSVVRQTPNNTFGERATRWLGIEWLGEPMPVRVWKWIVGRRVKPQGCGCMARPKSAWLKFVDWLGAKPQLSH